MTNDQSPARASRLAGAQRGLRSLALTAVIIGVLGLAAAAFDLSYPGIHALALGAGVSPTLARLYPPIFDAMLVVASAAILSLRGAGVVTRCYAWFSLLLLLCAAAAADALHATGTTLPHRGAAATVAIIPWALVLLGFGLLLAMLRHARLRRAHAAQARASAAPPARLPADSLPAAVMPAAVVPEAVVPEAVVSEAVVPEAVVSEAVVPVAVAPGAEVQAPAGPDRLGDRADGQAPELALDAEPGHDDPTSDEAHSASHPSAFWVPHARAAEPPAADGPSAAEDPAPIMSPAPVAEVIPGDPLAEHAPETEPEPGAGPEPDGAPEPDDSPEPGTAPVAPFERMWSSPTPPDM